YYEYRQPVYPGWRELEIDFARLSDTKNFPLPADSAAFIFNIPEPDSLLEVFYRRDPKQPESEFVVVGNPG
ncbi:MAG: hypothetical protein KDH84_27780, partial [Calditrichaeota bacterium]|nr:hypothetical protein [Calditrichota bacterium]